MSITKSVIRVLYIVNDPVTPLFDKYGGLPGMLKNTYEIIRNPENNPRHIFFPSVITPETSLEVDAIHAYVHRHDKDATTKLFPPVASLFVTGHQGSEEDVGKSSSSSTTSNRKYDCIILSGSARMVSDREPWANAEADWIREVIRTKKMPVLGICFGHQLLGQEIFGGVCENHETGGEWGCFDVKFTDAAKADPVFGPLASVTDKIRMSLTHSQSVRKLPQNGNAEGTTAILGFTDNVEPCQFVRYNELTYGIQGHPEYRAGFLKEEFASYHSEEEAAAIPTQKDEDDISPALLVHFLAFAMKQ